MSLLTSITGGRTSTQVHPSPGVLLIRRPTPSEIKTPGGLILPTHVAQSVTAEETHVFAVEAVGDGCKSKRGDSVILDLESKRIPVKLGSDFGVGAYEDAGGTVHQGVALYWLVPQGAVAATVTRKGD